MPCTRIGSKFGRGFDEQASRLQPLVANGLSLVTQKVYRADHLDRGRPHHGGTPMRIEAPPSR